jgi:hypothetical protein
MANPGPAVAGIPNTELQLSTGPLQRVIANIPLAGTAAVGNGSLGINYYQCLYPVSASRFDILVDVIAATSATALTAAWNFTQQAAIYSSSLSTNTAGSTSLLNLLSWGSTTATFSQQSNNAGATQFSVAGIRPFSVPMNINMQPGEYFVAMVLSSATASVGTATTSLGFSMSNVLGGSNLTASVYGEITASTVSTLNLQGFAGLYNSTTAGIPVTIANSQIIQTGASQAYGQFAFVMRNY